MVASDGYRASICHPHQFRIEDSFLGLGDNQYVFFIDLKDAYFQISIHLGSHSCFCLAGRLTSQDSLLQPYAAPQGFTRIFS